MAMRVCFSKRKNNSEESLILWPKKKRWTLDVGRWTLDVGRWTLELNIINPRFQPGDPRLKPRAKNIGR